MFGSEFTTEDTDTGKLEEYEINVLEERQSRPGSVENRADPERGARSEITLFQNRQLRGQSVCRCESKCLISTTMKSNDCWHRG